MPKIFIVDVTNRDGVQTAKLGLSKLEKTMINLFLNQMGVFQSEFGFPTTRHEANYLNANLELVERGIISPLRLEGWIRAIEADVELAFARIPKIKHLNLSISTSDQMINGKFQGRKNRKDIINDMTKAVDAAWAKGAESIGVNAEDASRTDIDYLIEFGQAAREHGATRIRYCDTLGYDNPFSIYDTAYKMSKEISLPIELHCHGDLGMAVANSLAGAKGVIDGGQDAYINTTVNGIGERAGNADLVATILAITKSKGFGSKYKLGGNIDLTMAYKICKFASYAFGVPIPINQPGVGANAFAHESGIHADGVLKDPENYELYGFEELGRRQWEIVETGREICAGEYSGVSGFTYVMSKVAVGKTFESRDEANRILELVRYANVLSHKPLTEEELRFIADYPDIARQLLTTIPLPEEN
ncbi:MAG: homocitrate synthase [Dehalococcoidales bacterium]|jgi:homocitrate synthase NifV|nr:homocitrate synthase [Dehalococcoidales bacterium]MDD5604523.1 homocitrate synthase [Dehalococcoidales bacterium]MDX9986501.1 homocitrate synthase [Dehalococcoidales bacterium]NLE90315.1 homocitrate synthase [Dehalococcoidales bacterium]